MRLIEVCKASQLIVGSTLSRAMLLGAMFSTSLALAAEPLHDVEGGADKLLFELSHSAQQITAMSGSFIQDKQVKGIPFALRSSGEFEYLKESGVVMRTLQPLASILEITASGVRYEHSEDVLPGSDMLAETLLGVFTGDLSGLAQYFELQATGTVEQWTIALIPLSEVIAGQVKTLTVSGGAFTERVEIVDGLGDVTTLSLDVVTSTPSLNEASTVSSEKSVQD